MKGRELTFEAITALQSVLPGWENSKLRNFGTTLGIRDTRKLEAKYPFILVFCCCRCSYTQISSRYNLTFDDCRSQARFDDAIGTFPEFLDGYSVLMLPTNGHYFHVPLSCMVSPAVDNLLVAGKLT